MDNFFEKPNLPDRKASLFIISDRKEQYASAVRKLTGAKVLTTAPVKGIDGEEKYHADMSIIHIGGNLFLSDKDNIILNNVLADRGAEVHSCTGITASRPLLNAFVLGQKMICCRKTVSDRLLCYCRDNNISILHTNQMYSKCSAAIVSDNALITSDESIYRLCLQNGIDALKISAGHIRLDGYDYGFIGGCCGRISPDTIVFCGELEKHPDSDNIKGFLLNYGIYALSLTAGELYDIGGILPIA